MKLHAELILIWKVSHLDSFWNRGTKELGNGLFGNGLFSTSFAMALFSQVGDNSFDLPEANVLIQVRQVKKCTSRTLKFIRIIHLDVIPLCVKFSCFSILSYARFINIVIKCIFSYSFLRFLRTVAQEGRLVYGITCVPWFSWRIFSENSNFVTTFDILEVVALFSDWSIGIGNFLPRFTKNAPRFLDWNKSPWLMLKRDWIDLKRAVLWF